MEDELKKLEENKKVIESRITEIRKDIANKIFDEAIKVECVPLWKVVTPGNAVYYFTNFLDTFANRISIECSYVGREELIEHVEKGDRVNVPFEWANERGYFLGREQASD
jgi:hypothetical protein